MNVWIPTWSSHEDNIMLWYEHSILLALDRRRRLFLRIKICCFRTVYTTPYCYCLSRILISIFGFSIFAFRILLFKFNYKIHCKLSLSRIDSYDLLFDEIATETSFEIKSAVFSLRLQFSVSGSISNWPSNASFHWLVLRCSY